MRCNATVKTKTACLLLKLSQTNKARADAAAAQRLFVDDP
jgi:hypothetical protein